MVRQDDRAEWSASRESCRSMIEAAMSICINGASKIWNLSSTFAIPGCCIAFMQLHGLCGYMLSSAELLSKPVERLGGRGCVKKLATRGNQPKVKSRQVA